MTEATPTTANMHIERYFFENKHTSYEIIAESTTGRQFSALPTGSSKIALLKEKGLIPAAATIGSDVGIHGIWKGGDDMIEMGVGWTDGCVAIKNKDIEELYTLVGVGTRVLIRK